MSFQGEGYDEVFVSKIKKIIESLESALDEKLIYVVNGCDDVCRYCPNRNGDSCKDEAQISNLDSSFSKILDVQQGDMYCHSEIRQMIRNKLSVGEFEEICRKCQWLQICRIALWN
ncbi:MAG: DUF1284 domain-containing protein [Holosporales bacterium]|jgi:hypothetical protein|nr:DUF1284 domain-containing protein [Holosporales bacterium]